jgi:hypothetical protein
MSWLSGMLGDLKTPRTRAQEEKGRQVMTMLAWFLNLVENWECDLVSLQDGLGLDMTRSIS